MVQTDRLYIDGAWRSAGDPTAHEVRTAAYSEPLYSVPESTVDEVESAVAAARRGFDVWSATPPEERAAAILRMRDLTLDRLDDIAATWAREAGMPVESARAATAALPISAMDYYARLAVDFSLEQELGASKLIYQPAGVAVGVTPWNYPFSQVAIKAITAIAAGCSIIVKPATLAPGCAFIFAEIVHEAGLPAGVFNLLTGSGSRVGESLVAHTGTDVVSFTGSTATGTRILHAAAARIKRCTLELGGKSPLIVLPDAPMDEAIANGMGSCFRNNGQTCTALTRFLVPRGQMGRAAELAAVFAQASVLGDPLDPATTMGPLVSRGQWDSVQQLIQAGIDEGATLVTGGVGEPDGFEGGNFVKPTVFADVAGDSTIGREEVFGPVLAIVPYDSVDEAIELANDSDYGLAAAVWGSDREAALDVGRKISAGVTSVNGGAFNAEAPYGGLRLSGLGHELGEYGYREYLDLKVLNA